MSVRATMPNLEGEVDLLDGVEVTHHFKTVETVPGLPVRWHYVTAGSASAPALLFLHGNPESWRAWEPQIARFAARYRVVAIDLKGYGQGEKRPGDWRWPVVAREFAGLLDHLGLDELIIVAHDRGCVLADYLSGVIGNRIRGYVRMQQVCHIWRLEHSPQGSYFADPIFGPYLFGDPDLYFRHRLGPMLKNPVPPQRLETLAYEMSYPGLADAVVRYYQSSSFEKERLDRMGLLPKMMFPVLLLQGDRDDGQPTWYYDHPESPAVDCFPDARLIFIEGAGHYTNLERPEDVTRHVANFLDHLEDEPA